MQQPAARLGRLADNSAARLDVDDRYTIVRRVGAGAFGVVLAAIDGRSGEKVAIKKISNAFEDAVSIKKALREIKLMQSFGGHHENILGLRDIMISPTFDALFLVMDFMDSDLHYIIHSRQDLSDGHVRWFTYQIFRGLKAIHSANAIHRDIKPSNLLVNKNCDLRICDFGLARGMVAAEPQSGAAPQQHLTEYVVTRWYRAPELIAQSGKYGAAVDIWSSGCILGELLGRKALLMGKDYLHQMCAHRRPPHACCTDACYTWGVARLSDDPCDTHGPDTCGADPCGAPATLCRRRLIVELLGTPSPSDLDSLHNPMAADYILQCHVPDRPTPLFAAQFPHVPPAALSLLEQLLQFDQARRLCAADALNHPYLVELHQLNHAPDAPPIEADAFEAPHHGEDELKKMIWAELTKFRPEMGPVPPCFAGGSPARVMDL